MDNRIWGLFAAVLVLLVIVCAAGCSGDDDDKDRGAAIKVDGKEYKWNSLEKDLGSKTVDDKSGVSLSALVADAGVSEPGSHRYDLVASDGYTKTVTWHFMELGIIIEENTMTYFPDLPKRYQVKDLVEIKLNDAVKTITINGAELTQDMPFDSWFDTIILNGTEGVQLSALINYTGVPSPGEKQYTITGYDDYSKSVTWDDMLNGVYVQEDHWSYFPDLENKYGIKDIKSIEVT